MNCIQGPVQQPHRRLQERELRPEDYSEHLRLEVEERGKEPFSHIQDPQTCPVLYSGVWQMCAVHRRETLHSEV